MTKSNKFLNLNGYQLIPEASRSSYFYIAEIVANYCWQKHNFLPINILTLVEYKTNKWQVYYAIKDRSRFLEVLQRFVKQPSLLTKMEKYLTETRESAIFHITEKPLESLTDKQLGNLLAFYYLRSQELHKAAMTLRLIDRGALDYFHNLFEKQNITNQSNIMSTSKCQSFTAQENVALLKLAVKVNKGLIKIDSKSYVQQLKKIYNNFCWLTLGYYDETLPSLEDYDKKVKNLANNKPALLLTKKNLNIIKEQKQRASLLKNYPSATKRIADVAAESSYLKDYFKFSTNKMQFYGEKIFQEISNRTNIKIGELKNLPHNIASALTANHGKFNKLEAKKYQRHTIFISLTGKIREKYIGVDADKYKKLFLTHSKNTTGEFKGRTACLGKVTGYAKVVYSPKDFNKVKKGNIIIVMNTGPDFVPVLSRVGAIVAEEGGITAHVSIISRELKVPCVVGIPHITQEIKDNDYLEVDANQGIVKILKSA